MKKHFLNFQVQWVCWWNPSIMLPIPKTVFMGPGNGQPGSSNRKPMWKMSLKSKSQGIQEK